MCLKSLTLVEIHLVNWYVVGWKLKEKWQWFVKSGKRAYHWPALPPSLVFHIPLVAGDLSEVCIRKHSLLFGLKILLFTKLIEFFFLFCPVLERDVYYCFPPQKKLIIHLIVWAFNWELHHLKLRDTTLSTLSFFCDPSHVLSMLIFIWVLKVRKGRKLKMP